MRKPEPGLSPEARKALLDRVSSRQTAVMTAAPEAPPKSSLRAADLDGYSEMRMIRSVQEGLGLETPYYRLHDHMDGARASIAGRTLLSFSGYDYLGLNSHQAVRDAAKNAIDKYGISAMASRITAGDRMPHRDLERGIANFIGTDDCVTMVSGHATNVTTIGQLLHAGDLILFDALAHNSIVIGAKLSGADRLSFAHNDLDNLERLLSSHRARHKRALIVIEGLYSMDGDLPDLPRLIEMKNRFGAWLMVDDAHGLGVLGATGRGLAEHWGVDPRDVDIWMGTLSKSLAGCGGYIAGSADVIDYLRHMVSGHVYSVGMPPSLAASALAALNVLRREPERVAELNAKGRQFTDLARARGFDTGTAVGSAIVPMIIGDSLKTATLAERLFHAGLYVMPIMPPGVPDHTARLRFFITLHHSDADLRQAVEMVAAAANGIGGFAGITET
jgi:8-amino-7-oxononanoate synthase